MNEIYIEGNNSANFLKITKVDDNKIRLKIGDCCVHIMDVTLTAEVFTNVITKLWLKENKPVMEFFRDNLSWDSETNDKFFEGCIDHNAQKHNINIGDEMDTPM